MSKFDVDDLTDNLSALNIEMDKLIDELNLVKKRRNYLLENTVLRSKLSQQIGYLQAKINKARRLKSRRNKRVIFSESNTSYIDVQENIISEDKIIKNTSKERDYSSLAGTSSLLLTNFFKRPVLIDSFSFNETNEPFRTVDVFSAWSQDPTVRAKLKTYAYFRGDLTLRIIVTSNPFQYGSLLFSNQPFSASNPVLLAYTSSGDATNTDGNFKRAFNSYLYQSPETILVQYGGDGTYEMDIPFLAPKPTVKLYNSGTSAINNATDFNEFTGLSRLFISEFNPLLNNSSDFDQRVSVEIYAYCKNAKLSVATSSDFDITAESDTHETENEGDKVRNLVNNNKILNTIGKGLRRFHEEGEYAENGAVSNIATAVSGITGKLSDVPFIGDFAKATSMATGKFANLARSFGFSKPVVLDKMTFRKNMAFPAFTSSGVDTSYKLTTDPKQELGVMFASGEEGMDQMSIAYLVGREAYMGTRKWTESLVPREGIIASFPIHPQSHLLLNTTEMHPTTPLGFCASFFRRWRGTIKVKIEVIAPRFAKGKLAIIYEPNNNIIGDTAPTQPNQQMIYYMDIGAERTKVIDCGFIFDRPFAKCGNVYLPTNPAQLNLSGNDARNSGSLIIKPFTRVTGADITEGAYVNFYMYSNDMEFALPNNVREQDFCQLSRSIVGTGSLTFDPPLVLAESDMQYTQYEKKDGAFTIESSTININKAPPLDPNAYLSNFGEQIYSFRQLFKKAWLAGARSHSISQEIVLSSAQDYAEAWFNIYPECGPNSNMTDTNKAVPFPFRAHDNAFNLFSNAFLFRRGGMRHKFVIYHFPDDKPGPVNVELYFSNNRDFPDKSSDILGLDVQGSALFHRNTNEGIEVEVPYYSSNFYEAVSDYMDGPPAVGSTGTNFQLHNDTVFDTQGNGVAIKYPSSGNSNILQYCSIAEDFSFLRFQGTPPYGNRNVGVTTFQTNFLGASPEV